MPSAWKPLEPGAIAIAHVSDPHFGSPKADEVWKHVDTFLTRELHPALVLVTGDLVHTPEEKLYDVALTAVKALKLPFFVCSGNHDRHVLGNRLEKKLLSIVSEHVLVKEGVSRARRYLKGLVWFVAALIGVSFGLILCVCVTLIAGTLASCLVGTVAGLLACVIVGRMSGPIERYLTNCAEAQIARFDSGYTNALFDQKFADYLLSSREARPVTLGNGAGAWEIGLLALESSLNADCFARGHIRTDDLLDLTTATQGNQVGGSRAEFDLCVLLVHHHVLPVRLLESQREGNASDLLNATCLVNTGILLEKMAEARIDLVLHGHEHKHNWGTYGSLEDGFGPVRVVAAGSATGNDSFDGCREDHSSFNLVILAPDRSVRLRRMVLEGGSWKQETDTDLTLFDPVELRQSRTRRRALIDTGDTRAEYKSEIVKYILFTRERDIEVYWLLTDWQLINPSFEHPVVNSTGIPIGPEVVLFAEGASVNVRAEFRRKKGQDHTWNLCFSVPREFLRKRIRITVQYTWQGGGLLTREELHAIRRGLGPFRNEGYDYATIWTNGQPVAALELHLSLPPEYAPRHVNVRVEQNGVQYEEEATDLQKQLRSLATGRYSLRIAHPRINRDYTLFWEPVPEQVVSKEMKNEGAAHRFVLIARQRGEILLRAFGEALRPTQFWDTSVLALYVKSADSRGAERVGLVPLLPEGGTAYPVPPKSVDLNTERHCLVQAWWGVAGSEIRTSELEEAKEVGLEQGEIGMVCVPIRFSLNATNPPPWGVVRIGIVESVELSAGEADGTIWRMLSAAAARLLAEALHEE